LTPHNPRATVGAVSQLGCILVAATILIQASPVRACAWEQLIAGSACHDRDSSEPDHAPWDREHDCVCAMPFATIHPGPAVHPLIDFQMVPESLDVFIGGLIDDGRRQSFSSNLPLITSFPDRVLPLRN
jgi:hypothetical protein